MFFNMAGQALMQAEERGDKVAYVNHGFIITPMPRARKDTLTIDQSRPLVAEAVCGGDPQPFRGNVSPSFPWRILEKHLMRKTRMDVDQVAPPSGRLRLWVNNGKAIPIIQDQLGVINVKLLGVPILDQAIEHIKIMREVTMPAGSQWGKTNWHCACKCALRRNESILSHCDALLWLVTQIQW
jgi:hypothetical protein